MTAMESINIFNMPMAQGIWRTMGSNLADVAQSTCEFIDNAISNFRGNPGDGTRLRQVKVSVVNLGDRVKVTVEDNGTGIQNLNNALTLAGTEGRESPLNEHGFGLKHALAYMDENNCAWEILTRTEEDCRCDHYVSVKPPYEFDGMTAEYKPGWVGTLGTTGTVIRFICPMAVFESMGRNGKTKLSFQQLVGILCEHLRYTYATILQRRELILNLVWESDGQEHSQFLEPLLPQWEVGTLVELPDQEIVFDELGKEKLTISCRYGHICPDEDAYLHYVGNMESSGAEIRLNGRVVEHGLLKEIWGRARHNVYNTFLVQIDLQSEDANSLPATKTAKNGFRIEMSKIQTVFEWVRANVTLPPKVSKEHQLRKKLAEIKAAEEGVTCVEEERAVFSSDCINVPADLFVSRGEKVTLYECKVKNTSCLNTYQLRMYWDGCVRDGIHVEEGILIAQNHPAEVVRLIRRLNQLTGPDGRRYNFRTALWAEEGIAV